MKKLICVFLLLALLTDCSSDDNPRLSISETSLFFSADGSETQLFQIESNSIWNILGCDEWLILDVASGEGDKQVSVKAAPNEEEVSRSLQLKVTCQGIVKAITVSQLGKNVELDVSVSKIEEEANEIIKQFEIMSNNNWIIENSADWLEFIPMQGSSNMTVDVKIRKNPSREKRESIATVRSGSQKHEIAFIQLGLQTSILEITDLVHEYYSDASQASFEVKSDGEWQVTSDAEWCRLEKKSGENGEIIKYTISENKESTERRALITVKSGLLEDKLLIKQAEFINVSDNPYQINQRDNAFRAGDKIIKTQIEYTEPRESGENVRWVFDNLKVSNPSYDVAYESAPFGMDKRKYIMGFDEYDYEQPKAKSLVVVTEHNTMYYHEIEGGELRRTGHENVAILLQYPDRMVLNRFPFYFNDTFKKTYKSKGLYSGSYWSGFEGYFEINADAYGSLVIESRELDHVIRIKSSQLLHDLDNDNIVIKESERIMETYTWYAKGYRYPVMELLKFINVSDGSILFKSGFYCIDGNVRTENRD